jgi:outer membrane protein OmpA-like peptidoglycan-associated protein
MKHLLRFVGSIIFTMCLSVSAFSQSSPATSTVTGHAYWGFDLGLTGSAYEGNQNFFWHMVGPADPTGATFPIQTYASFDNLGSGLGFLLGAKVGVPIINGLDLQAKARYLTNYASSTKTHSNFDQSGIPTTATNSYSLLLSNLSFAALADIRLSDNYYAVAGLEFSTLLNNSITLHQQLDPNGSSYYAEDATTGVFAPTGVFSLDHPASSVSDYFVSSRVALQIGAGTAFHISESSPTLLDLELLFSIPFTQWLSPDQQTALNTLATAAAFPAITYPKLWYASLTIGIRFPFSSSTATTASDEAASHAATSTASTPAIGDDGKVALQGRVTDAKTGEPVNADITVIDLTNNEAVATDHTDAGGRYNVRVHAPGKYSVTADAPGYLFGTSYFEVDKQGRILASHPNIKLSKSSGGKTRLLVFFDFAKADLTAASYPELDRAVRLMKAVPSMKVEIAGYTDSIGSVEYNRDLSEKRANAVRNYLIKKGIASARVAAHGYGMQSPIADNSTEEGRAENRRVEFVVTNE